MSARIQHEYDQDFYTWTVYNAELIRQGRLSEVDLENVAEEIESMGKSEKRELINRLAILMTHLLKWKFQANKRSQSWKYTIKAQRMEILRLLKQSPSLKYQVEASVSDAYEQSIVNAAGETSLDENVFPKACPFSLEQCLDHSFFPDDEAN